MKIIRGRRHWVLTAESPRLTMTDDNNTLAVFAGYCTRSLFPLPAFLNDVAGKGNRKAMNRNWINQKAYPALKTKAGNK